MEIDFQIMHPDCSMKLYSEWPKLSAFLFKKIPVGVKDQIEEALTPGN